MQLFLTLLLETSEKNLAWTKLWYACNVNEKINRLVLAITNQE